MAITIDDTAPWAWAVRVRVGDTWDYSVRNDLGQAFAERRRFALCLGWNVDDPRIDIIPLYAKKEETNNADNSATPRRARHCST